MLFSLSLTLSQFSVNYKARNNNAIKRDDVIKVVAGQVTCEDQYPHRVDLHNAELVIIVDIIKVCMSIMYSTLATGNHILVVGMDTLKALN